jgi:PPK2 family polyphosphate:nucleotide phosphotransferase
MIKLSKEDTKADTKFDKKETEKETEKLKEQIFEMQNLLYAEKKHSLLVILQGSDASGKDGTVRHVFSAMNPMGVTVKAFKAPTEEEMEHDFLWRVHQHVPAKGMIQIFNRSHYEDILVPSVHKTLDKELIEKRYDRINNFEQGLVESGTVILKFFLHISREEQDERIKERLTDPKKKWKYDPADKREMHNWDGYMEIYEKIFEKCSPKLPWIIVPADHKWYRNYIVAKEMVNTLKSLKMKYPR